ncbi:MAG: NUDIX domain-containing protein [Candidatus Doudnabacteria bacterium]|nr:NUDIX domain-containing protein [Candidatus Doudnabacteria bacterium]
MDYVSPEPENEILQCCDENGKITVGKTRAEVHEQPLKFWHLTTGIYVVNPEGRILCSKRSEKLNQNPGRWQMAFGGHVKYSQTPAQNAVDELDEEIGLKVSSADLYFLDTRKNPNFKHVSWLYAYVFDGKKSDIKFNDGEIEKVEWRDMLEALQEGQKDPANWASLCYLEAQDKINQWLKTK